MTIACIEVDWKEASRFGIMHVDERQHHVFRREAEGADEQSGIHGHLYFLLACAAAVFDSRRGEPPIRQ